MNYEELLAKVAELTDRKITRDDLPMAELKREVLFGEPVDPNELLVPHGIGWDLLSERVAGRVDAIDARVGHTEDDVEDLDDRVTVLESASGIESPIVVGSGGGAPAYGAGWSTTPLRLPAQFYKHDGRVYLAGTVTRTSGTNSVVFTLPAGYRPATGIFVPVSANVTGTPSAGHVYMATAGEVLTPTGAPTTNIDLSPISFRVA